MESTLYSCAPTYVLAYIHSTGLLFTMYMHYGLYSKNLLELRQSETELSSPYLALQSPPRLYLSWTLCEAQIRRVAIADGRNWPPYSITHPFRTPDLQVTWIFLNKLYIQPWNPILINVYLKETHFHNNHDFNCDLFMFFFLFYYCFTYILMPHNMMILYFCLPDFHVLYGVLFSTSYFSSLILHRRLLFGTVMTLSSGIE